MSTSVLVDNFRPACAALERSAPLLLDAMRRAPADARPPGMRWTNSEIAAHMYGTAVEAARLMRGEPSLYEVTGITAEKDEQLIATIPDRDMDVLADKLTEATVAMLATARDRPADQPVNAARTSVATFIGLIAMDHHLHGGQFAETTGTQWTGRVADMGAPFRIALDYAFDPGPASPFRGSFKMQLRGAEATRVRIDRGELLPLDGDASTDCSVSDDPQTFLRYGIGLVSQTRAILTGQMLAFGRKPWLALSLNRLFPQVPHGGLLH